MNGDVVNGMYTNLVVPRGTNLRSERSLPLLTLSATLSRTVVFLRGLAEAAPKLYRYDDWWEHDGLHLSRGREDEVTDFGALSSLVETPEAMKAAMPGDYHVFVGVAPSDFRWYLRFYCDCDRMLSLANDEATGRFDISLPRVLADDYRQQVAGPLDLRMEEQESLSYYQSIGMGA